jgi:site-specific DNA recombinase
MEQKRVIGYIRVSTTLQDAERQRVQIERYCEENGYNLIGVLKDEGISGAIKYRPSYLKLLQLTKEDADIVIVSELSRLSRQEDIIATLSDVNSLLQRELDIIFIDNNSYYKKTKTPQRTIRVYSG